MNSESRTSCLVTGALGFLGRSIVAEFAAAGYRVIGVDRGALDPAELESAGLAEFVRAELPSTQLGALLDTVRPDVIVHAAGPASVADSMQDPRSDFEGTVGVLVALLDAVRINSPASRVIILSSAAVYGNPETLPITECDSGSPVSPYGFHKRMAEEILLEFALLYGIPSCAARVFSAYGAGLKRQLLWDVCRKALADPKVRLFGTGDETRDFVHASDVARAILVLAQNAPMKGESYNVASGTATTIRDVALTLAGVIGPEVTVEFSGEQRPGDPLYWQADISAISELGFVPRVTLDEGAKEYAAWCLAGAGK